ncbi:centromere protein K [Rhinophrynus dorsalis]
MDKQDALLKEAEELARHMSTYQHELPSSISKTTETSEEAMEELVQQCEEIWKQMEECQSQLTMQGTDTLPECDVQLYLLMMQVKALTVEYEQWQNKTPEIISNNQDVLLAIGKEELEKVDRDLEMILSSVQAKNKELKKDLEKEQNWLSGQQQLVDALTARKKDLENQLSSYSKKRMFEEFSSKLLKVRAYKDELLSALGDFLEEHFPLPEQHVNSKKKKKGIPVEPPVQLITLHEILEILMNKLLKTPHDPYIELGPQHWPPYIEMLLRHGIALRHPEDPNRIRLEAFHQ